MPDTARLFSPYLACRNFSNIIVFKNLSNKMPKGIEKHRLKYGTTNMLKNLFPKKSFCQKSFCQNFFFAFLKAQSRTLNVL